MIGLLIHGDLLHLGNRVRPNDAPVQPSFFLNLISTCKFFIIHRGQSKKLCKIYGYHKTIKMSFIFNHKVWQTYMYHIFTIKVNALMPTIGYYSNVILIEWKWLHRSGVFEKFLNFVENKALKFLNISNNFNTFNIQQRWKVNAMFKQVKC